MSIEVREIWVNGVRYTIEEAQALLSELDSILLAINPPLLMGGVTESDFQKIKASVVGPIPKGPKYSSKHCTTCGGDDHNKQTCTLVDKSRKYLCSVCGEPDHNKRTCSKKRRIHCSICGEADHNKATCSVVVE